MVEWRVCSGGGEEYVGKECRGVVVNQFTILPQDTFERQRIW